MRNSYEFVRHNIYHLDSKCYLYKILVFLLLYTFFYSIIITVVATMDADILIHVFGKTNK